MLNSTFRQAARWDPRTGNWVPYAQAGEAPAESPPGRAAAFAPGTMALAKRMYASARPSRGTIGFGSYGNSSADSELASSLTALRSRSRQMVRDNPYAKRAKLLVVNNVIGPGVGMQAQVMNSRNGLYERANTEIEERWCEWANADSCHTGGSLHFHDIERVAMGHVFEAGEAFIRVHFRAFGRSRVPLSLEFIEPERIAGEFETVNAFMPQDGAVVRMGIEVDRFGRPVAYYVRTRHPGDYRFRDDTPDAFERVPAAEMIHLRLIDRWPQTRGEPWLHTVLTKLDAMNEYSAAEVQAARDSAYYFATIQKESDPDGPPPFADSGAGTGQGDATEPPSYSIEPGMVQELEPGEKLEFHTPNRPNTAIDAFLKYMLREVAAGLGVSFASLSQNFSDTNYSSSRLSLLDDRDCWRVLQQWWIRTFRLPFHRMWIQQATFARAFTTFTAAQLGAAPDNYQAVLFKPRGWSWVDPSKEVEAYKEAIRGGLTTLTDAIAATGDGKDIEDVVRTRQRELKMLEAADIAVDTTVAESLGSAGEPGDSPPVGGAAAEGDPPADQEGTNNDPQARVVSLRR